MANLKTIQKTAVQKHLREAPAIDDAMKHHEIMYNHHMRQGQAASEAGKKKEASKHKETAKEHQLAYHAYKRAKEYHGDHSSILGTAISHSMMANNMSRARGSKIEETSNEAPNIQRLTLTQEALKNLKETEAHYSDDETGNNTLSKSKEEPGTTHHSADGTYTEEKDPAKLHKINAIKNNHWKGLLDRKTAIKQLQKAGVKDQEEVDKHIGRKIEEALQLPGLTKKRQALNDYENARSSYSRNPTDHNREWLLSMKKRYEDAKTEHEKLMKTSDKLVHEEPANDNHKSIFHKVVKPLVRDVLAKRYSAPGPKSFIPKARPDEPENDSKTVPMWMHDEIMAETNEVEKYEKLAKIYKERGLENNAKLFKSKADAARKQQKISEDLNTKPRGAGGPDDEDANQQPNNSNKTLTGKPRDKIDFNPVQQTPNTASGSTTGAMTKSGQI